MSGIRVYDVQLTKKKKINKRLKEITPNHKKKLINRFMLKNGGFQDKVAKHILNI